MTVISKSGIPLEVVATSLAARATTYNSDGLALNPETKNIFSLPVSVRFSAALTAAASAFVWSAVWEGHQERKVRIRRISLRGTFDGTEAASSTQFQLIKFTGAVPSAGTSLLPLRGMITNKSITSQIYDARVSTGAALLTTTGALPDPGGYIMSFVVASRNGSNAKVELDSVRFNTPQLFVMGNGEGLALVASAGNTVIGMGISGSIHWEEW